MCTVTFIPVPGATFITSNRDESPVRRASGLHSVHSAEKNVIHFPLDEDSGGSWVALSDSGRAVCLLNGGFESYIPGPSYRQSRGQVVADAAGEPDVNTFLDNYDFERIAPFTLLLYEEAVFHQLVWDGGKKHISSLSLDQPQIWSSVTLYPSHVRAWRKKLFDTWLKETTDYDRESIIRFHQMANGDPDNDFIMNRNEIVKTLSITSIVLKQSSASMMHLELDRNIREEILVKYE